MTRDRRLRSAGPKGPALRTYGLAGLFLWIVNLLACNAATLPPGGGAPRQAQANVLSQANVLEEGWKAYVARFIQADGRVIDPKRENITTSEGQAYAMLRAVWMGDRVVFDRVHTWALHNLNAGIRADHLWAWKWGEEADGRWRVLDRAFASDADQDAALALVIAWKTWSDERYLTQALAMLADLWSIGTLEAGGGRYLLAGDTLCGAHSCKVNPSYAAPYAYRIFSRVDPARSWTELVDSSYFLLETASSLTGTHLPPDWIHLDRRDGRLSLGDEKESAFSYDAFRVYWRVALDKELFNAPRAAAYLDRSLDWIVKEWQLHRRLPAIVSRRGESRAEYESLEMLAALLPALDAIRPEIAAAMHGRLESAYANGVWGDEESYYLQNWAWFGIAAYQKRLAPFQTVR